VIDPLHLLPPHSEKRLLSIGGVRAEGARGRLILCEGGVSISYSYSRWGSFWKAIAGQAMLGGDG
jgi:hypothetical protein